jgi:hypothetical protein
MLISHPGGITYSTLYLRQRTQVRGEALELHALLVLVHDGYLDLRDAVEHLKLGEVERVVPVHEARVPQYGQIQPAAAPRPPP